MKPRLPPDKSERFWSPTFSLRFHLIALVVVALVPLLLFSGWLITQQSKAERMAIEKHLLDTAKELAVDVDREVIAVQGG
jgi:hypothetical protein